MPNPDLFIASPLFNKPQIDIIQRIESMLSKRRLGFYSARLHSGSDLLTPEQKKDPTAWQPVFDSNLRGMNMASVMIAVLEYAYPSDTGLYIHRPPRKSLAELEAEEGVRLSSLTQGGHPVGNLAIPEYIPVELPDAGTVYEMGYFTSQRKIVVGFHSTKRPEHLNLMLSHGCDGLLCGWEALEKWLTTPDINPLKSFRDVVPASVYAKGFSPTGVGGRSHVTSVAQAQTETFRETALKFDWTACSTWNKEIE